MGESIVRPGFDNPRALVFERASFWDATVDGYTKPPGQNPDYFTTLEDVEPVTDNVLNRRRGYVLLSNPTCAARGMFEAYFSNGRHRLILTSADRTGASSKDNQIVAINANGDRFPAAGTILTPAATAVTPYVAVSRDFAYICDGVSGDLKKWDSDDTLAAGSVTDWGMSASGAVFTATPAGGGSINLEVGRRYLVAFLYTVTGETCLYDISSGGTDEQHTTDSVNTGPQTNLTSVGLASLPLYTIGSSGFVAANMHRVILATSDGGPLDTLYEIGRITNNTTTTFTDDYTEEAVLASPVWAELTLDGAEVGIYDNTRPSTTIPTATIVIPHRGRLFAITEQFLFWSKNLEESTSSTNTLTGRFESSWPAANQLPVATASEFGRGLFSDGARLYIATDRSIRYCDDWAGTLSPPQTLFNEVGLMRQHTWKAVAHEGKQTGAIWLTPDRRVVASDFNTYGDIGRPIQEILNDINIARARVCAHATFVSDGPYEFYALAIPAPGVNTTTNSGTAQAGAASTITLAAGASAVNDFYNTQTITTTSGTGSGQSRTIFDYVGATKVATITPPWTTTPDNTTGYSITAAECDTLCIYNMSVNPRTETRHNNWFIWKPAEVDNTLGVPGNGIFAQAYLQDTVNNRSLWAFSTANGGPPTDGRVYRWHTGTEWETANNLRDRNSASETPVSFDVTIRTSWLDWGLPQVVKFLNELELHTGDSALTVTVEGANTKAQFSSPTTVSSATAVTALPQSGQYKRGLASKFTKYRFYRFTFNSPAGTTRELLSYLAIEAIPFHRY